MGRLAAESKVLLCVARAAVREGLGRRGTSREVEVENIDQALQMAKFSPGAIMFDNFNPDNIKKAIKEIQKTNPNIIFGCSNIPYFLKPI